MVTAVDFIARRATVEYVDEPGEYFELPVINLLPASVGSVVRVNGPLGARYIDAIPDGRVGLRNLHLDMGGDATLTSTGHSFQIGNDDDANLIIDNNEVLARNAGETAPLFLNQDGGQVNLNGTNLRVQDDHEVVDKDNRQFIRTDTSRTQLQLIQYGNTAMTTDANGLASFTYAEAYTTAPAVTAIRSTTSSSERTVQLYATATTGFTVRVMDAGTPLNAGSATISWIAIGSKTNT